jgi:putative transposase
LAGTYTKLFYHIVFSTKNRQPCIPAEIEEELHRYMGGIVRGIGGTTLEINGMTDHVHILATLPPKIAISDALREIKANSSKWMHESKGAERFYWQDRFSAFTVSKSQVEIVRQYIREQKSHHARVETINQNCSVCSISMRLNLMSNMFGTDVAAARFGASMISVPWAYAHG